MAFSVIAGVFDNAPLTHEVATDLSAVAELFDKGLLCKAAGMAFSVITVVFDIAPLTNRAGIILSNVAALSGNGLWLVAR